jgi:alkylation response protein AidB-like acyl-CoA dehydrogenase
MPLANEAMHGAIAFPACELPAEAEALRTEVRDFLAAEMPAGSHYTQSSREFSRKLGARGWIGMTWPRRWGGAERTNLERYVVVEELLAAGAPIFYHWVADRQSGPLILRFGTEAQRDRFLPEIVRGTCGFAIGLSEPNAGSDLSAIETRAVRADGGWRISGTKIWTSNAHIAEFMILLGRTAARGESRRHGLTQFIVDLRSSGIRVNPILNIARQHEFNEVVLDGVFVPEDMVLGPVDQGWDQLISELAFERSGPDRFLSAFDLFRQFVVEVGPNPSDGESDLIGRLAAHLWTLRRMSMSVAHMLQEKSPMLEAAIVKDLGNRFEQEVVAACRTLRPAFSAGGAGQAYREAYERALLYMPRVTIQGGTPQILRNAISRELGLR